MKELQLPLSHEREEVKSILEGASIEARRINEILLVCGFGMVRNRASREYDDELLKALSALAEKYTLKEVCAHVRHLQELEKE